ncbi:MAG: permease [Tissierellaceae bacterium]|nr:permease [Tissierellaceae bacterium]
MKLLKRYLMFILSLGLVALAFIWNKDIGVKSVNTIINSSKEMMLILPPVFILLGLLDVWVPRDTMVKFMGEESGLLGAVLAFLVGSAAAGPLYVVFPIAAAFMKKDAKFSNILILIGAWSNTKIPMLLFEYSSLGGKFMFTRLALNIPMILLMTFIMNHVLKADEKAKIYELANSF